MVESTLARPKASPIVEVPGSAIRAAAGFTDCSDRDLGCVVIRPGDNEDEVVILAASRTRMVEITAEGRADREVMVPGVAFSQINRRHPEAEHIAIVPLDMGAMLSIRSFSKDMSIQVAMPEGDGTPMLVPDFKPGPHQIDPIYFNPNALVKVLQLLGREGKEIAVQPFSIGLIVRCTADHWRARAFVAGCEKQKDK